VRAGREMPPHPPSSLWHPLPMGEGLGLQDGNQLRGEVNTRIVSEWPASHPLC
jgi:hypothetical protein